MQVKEEAQKRPCGIVLTVAELLPIIRGFVIPPALPLFAGEIIDGIVASLERQTNIDQQEGEDGRDGRKWERVEREDTGFTITQQAELEWKHASTITAELSLKRNVLCTILLLYDHEHNIYIYVL